MGSHCQHSHGHEDSGRSEEQCSNAEDDDAIETTRMERRGEGKGWNVGGADGVLRRLKVATALCLVFLSVEVTGGLIARSLAVLSDAAHLFADLASFAVAILVAHIATLPPTKTHTFGFKRSEALAALFSMLTLAVVSIFLAASAVRRLWLASFVDPVDPVDGKMMTLIAAIGVVVNVALAIVLGQHHVHLPGGGGHDHSHDHDHSLSEKPHGHGHGHDHRHDHNNNNGHDHHSTSDATKNDATRQCIDSEDTTRLIERDCHDSYHSIEVVHMNEVPPGSRLETAPARNLNLEAAYLHVLGDLAQSVAVLLAGLVIWAKPRWQLVDPMCTILFCLLVGYSTVGVIRSSVAVLLEEVPPNIQWQVVHDAIHSIPGVANVHDLHIWSISHGSIALTVHASADDVEQSLRSIHDICHKFRIDHATVQLQPNHVPDCITCGEGMTRCKQ